MYRCRSVRTLILLFLLQTVIQCQCLRVRDFCGCFMDACCCWPRIVHDANNFESFKIAIYTCFVLYNYCGLNSSAVDIELFKIQIGKNEQNRLTNTIQDTVFFGNLDEGKITKDVLLSSINSAIHNQI